MDTILLYNTKKVFLGQIWGRSVAVHIKDLAVSVYTTEDIGIKINSKLSIIFNWHTMLKKDLKKKYMFLWWF